MHVRQVVLSADRELLDHELEVVVARERHDLLTRLAADDTESGRNRPAERTGLTGVDPLARTEHVQHLRGLDLRKTDR